MKRFRQADRVFDVIALFQIIAKIVCKIHRGYTIFYQQLPNKCVFVLRFRLLLH